MFKVGQKVLVKCGNASMVGELERISEKGIYTVRFNDNKTQSCDHEELEPYYDDVLKSSLQKNGAELIQHRYCGNNIVVVLATRKYEYVTWLYNIETNSLFSGNYFSHFGNDIEKYWEMAFSDYHKRIEKELF